MNDLKFAFRQLLKNPGFTAVAVLKLALGIGANTAIFSIFNALLVRRLPFPNPDRLVWVEEISKQSSQEPWGGHFLDWQEHSQTLEAIATYDNATRTLITKTGPERVEVSMISAGFLSLLGAYPIPPGRSFSATEDKPGGERVAILSHELWQRHFRGDPDIVGRSITLDDASYAVIGVLPERFRFFHPIDVCVPLALDPKAQLAGDIRYFGPTMARLKPGMTMERAQAELDTLLKRYENSRPEGMGRIESHTRLISLQEHLLGDTRLPLLVLLCAVGFLLLIACANVANLLLARAVTRQKEMSVRAALGASWQRLTRQMLTECLVLALAGGGAGLLLAYWLTRLLASFNLADTLGPLAGVTNITVDPRVLGFALLLSIGTGLLFGLLPALRLSDLSSNFSLMEGACGTRSLGRRLRSALMMSEVALAILLLCGAGLLIRSFVKLVEVNPGYRAEHLLTARFQLPPRYSERLQRVQFYERLLQRVGALPGVISVGATSHLPLVRYNMGGTLRVEGRVPEKGEREPSAPITSVNPDYFRTMGINLRAGRLLKDTDTDGALSVALMSEALARKLFPNGDTLGKRLFVAGEWRTIVGIVADIRHQGLDQGIEQAVYLSYRQLPRPGMALVLRSTGDPLSLVSALRDAVQEIDPELPIYDVLTMKARLSHSVAGRRFNLSLLGGFATLALLLAGIGAYGVIGYVVTERTREIGIRMALGAQRRDVLSLVVGQGMGLALLGVGIGLGASLALSRVLQTLLFEIEPTDPLTFATAPLVLAAVVLIACWVPARRAASVDPVEALRYE